tara:strand:- start:58 stop:2175 length:2118 start_codon:yes stop_codon:yes gene_type:complete
MADKKNDGIDLFSAANVPPKKTTAQTGVFRVPDIVDPNDLIEIDEDERRSPEDEHFLAPQLSSEEPLLPEIELEEIVFSISPERLSPGDHTASFRVLQEPDREARNPTASMPVIPERERETAPVPVVKRIDEEAPIAVLRGRNNPTMQNPVVTPPTGDIEELVPTAKEFVFTERSVPAVDEQMLKDSMELNSVSPILLSPEISERHTPPSDIAAKMLSEEDEVLELTDAEALDDGVDVWESAIAEAHETSPTQLSLPAAVELPSVAEEDPEVPGFPDDIDEALLLDLESNTDRPLTNPHIALSSSVNGLVFDIEDTGEFRRSVILPQDKQQSETSQLERFEKVSVLQRSEKEEHLLVRDRDLHRLVRVVRQLEASKGNRDLWMFTRQIRLLSQLHHPGIVPVFDVGLDDEERVFYVMDYVEGTRMDELISLLNVGDVQAHRKFPPPMRNLLFLKLCEIVQYAHQHGIIHRDVKPANVIIGECGEVYLTGWEIAKDLHASDFSYDTQQELVAIVPELYQAELRKERVKDAMYTSRSSTLIGTPAYMSPEQAQAKHAEIDERSDIFALGVLYYEWMTCVHPFATASDEKEMTSLIREGEAQNMASIRHSFQAPIPRQFSDVAASCMEKSPLRRFQSMAELVEALSAAISGDFESKTPLQWFVKKVFAAGRFAEVRPLLFTFGFGLVCAMMGLGLYQLAVWSWMLFLG